MNREKISQELLAVAKLLAGGEDKYNSPLDQWLVDNGWDETHGIALYTNPKYPLVGIDTNSGEASIQVFHSKSKIFNDEGSLVDYTDSLGELKKAVMAAGFQSELWRVLSKKYPSYKGLMPSSGISFFGGRDRDDEVSFHIYTDNWTVTVGGGIKFQHGEISKKMSPNVRSIVKFIEKAQQEILAGGKR